MRFYHLNLVNAEGSDISYKVSKFPDGQQSIELTGDGRGNFSFLQGMDVKISSRMNSFKDLELIICANQALRNHGVNSVSLHIPYLLGARSDRQFTAGGVNYLKQVICPIINSQKFDSVVVLDPHSDVTEACLDNFVKADNTTIVRHALTDIDNRNDARERVVLVSPDAGSLKKIYHVAETFDIDKIAIAAKHRDVRTGKITHTEVPNLPISLREEEMKYVIIDDICDGGRTFIELAKAIREQRPTAQIYLIVTHGIFSAGFLELSKYVTKIYCSNSYSDIDVESHSDHTVREDLLMQFNVFK